MPVGRGAPTSYTRALNPALVSPPFVLQIVGNPGSRARLPDELVNSLALQGPWTAPSAPWQLPPNCRQTSRYEVVRDGTRWYERGRFQVRNGTRWYEEGRDNTNRTELKVRTPVHDLPCDR